MPDAMAKGFERRWALLDKDSMSKYETIHMRAMNWYKEELMNYKPSLEFLEKNY